MSSVNDKQFMTSVFAGGSAGIIARTCVAPLDRLKINAQTSSHTGFEKNTLKFTKNIMQKDGISGLWKGNGMNCIRVMPHSAIQFVSFDLYKSLIHVDSLQQKLISGALSGATAISVTHPIDVVRIRLQTTRIDTIKNALVDVYRENGMKTFYKGYVPSVLSIAPFISINFTTFDYLKQINTYPSSFDLLCMGGISGCIAQTFCYPLDTIRRKMQLRNVVYKGIRDAFTTTIKNEGLVGLYRGMGVNALKVMPNNAIRFCVYEKIVQIM